jgi:hypothetical protein
MATGIPKTGASIVVKGVPRGQDAPVAEGGMACLGGLAVPARVRDDARTWGYSLILGERSLILSAQQVPCCCAPPSGAPLAALGQGRQESREEAQARLARLPEQ